MADDIIVRDANDVTGLAGVTDDANHFIKNLLINPANGRLKVSATVSSGSGITSINGQTDAAQIIDRVSDTNVTLTITQVSTDTNRFTVGWSGTLAMSRGGLGVALVDPNADRIVFWDDSAGNMAFLTVGTGLTITGTTLTADAVTGFATTALDNLASVAINTSLLLGTSDGGALGSATKMWSDLFLADGGVINWNNGDVLITQSTNTLAHTGASSGYTFDALVMPASDDGAPLGNTTHNWSDLFLASGAVINIANGNWVATHTSAILTIGTGTLKITTPTNTTTSVVTIDGTQTLTNKSIVATQLTGTVAPANGGTGVANNASSTITISGSFALTLTLSNTTGVTLPTTGTLATLAGSETLSNKTLTAPKFANAGFIADANGNELIIFTTTASAVNEITVANGATGNNATITASGETNTGITITGKGTKGVAIGNALLEKVSVVTDGAGAVIDASLGNTFTWVAGADRTAGTTTNPVAGQRMVICFTASGGARTLTLPTSTTGDFAYGSDITVLTQTASGKTDAIGCIYGSVIANRWAVVAYVKGF